MKLITNKKLIGFIFGLIFISCIMLIVFIYNKYSITLSKISELEKSKPTMERLESADFINKNQKYDNNKIKIKEYKDSEAEYMYYNIDFISYSSEWDKYKLSELAEELFDNVHGEEIKYVDRVLMYGESGGYIAGTHEKQNTLLKIPLGLYSFFPKNLIIEFPRRGAIISLYNCDSVTDVEEMAYILSHEYGHHFVEFYLGVKGVESDENTEYYKLRSEGFEDKIITERTSSSDYMENHMWYLAEIAAEDYVYFMGSENTKRIVKFYDNKDKIDMFYDGKAHELEDYGYRYKPSRNSTPHENVELSLPNNVEGLKELFYSFVDEEPDEYTKIEEERPDLNIKFERDNLYYIFTWDKPYKEEDVIYTVNLFKDEKLLYTVKSINGTERALARIGGRYNYDVWQAVQNIKFFGRNGVMYRVRISITLPDSTVIYSKYLDFKMENSEWWVRHEKDNGEESDWERNR